MTNVKISQLPKVANSLLTDIFPVNQGGSTVAETLLQVSQLITQQVILNYPGNPNGNVAGQTYQLLWDTTDKVLYIATTTGTATSTIWTVIAGGGGSAVPIGPAGGDLGSTYPNPTVLKLNTVPLGVVTATAGNLLIGTGTSWSSAAISGDATLSSVGLLTLHSVNANVGTFGDASHSPQFSVNAKGLITGVSNISISIPISNLTDSAWTDYSGTIVYTGFSGTPTTTLALWKQIGKTVFLAVDMTGTSNANTFTFSLPVTAGTLSNSATVSIARGVDNGTYSAAVYGTISTGSNVCTLVLNDNSTGWTTSGTKAVRCSIFYESA